MKTFSWTVTGAIKVGWAVQGKKTRGEVNANTRSEAIARIKKELGGYKLPDGMLIDGR